MFLTCVCDVHCWYMYSPLVSFFPVAYLSCSKTTTVLGRLGGSAMFFKHLVSWKFARVHLQNAGWHSIFTLLRSSANVRHDFLSFMFVPYDQFFLGQIPVLCTAQMNKNSQDPQRSAFNFSKPPLILTASNKMAACLTPGRKETGAEVASFPPFSPLAGDASLWPITTKIELTRTKWVGREKIPLAFRRPFGE